MADPSPVVHNEAERRFESSSEGKLELLDYRLSGNVIKLMHTEVPDELAGRGVAGSLARAALEHARAAQLQVVPLCSFVSAYIRRHPEYNDLVQAEYRAQS